MMKLENTTALIGGCCALVGCFMPLATSTASVYFISLQHLGGATVLLYPIAFLAIVSSIAGLYKKLHRVEMWQLACGASGLAISVIAFLAAKQQLSLFVAPDPFAVANMIGGGRAGFSVDATLKHGWGTTLLVGGFVLVLMDGLLLFKDRRLSSQQPMP